MLARTRGMATSARNGRGPWSTPHVTAAQHIHGAVRLPAAASAVEIDWCLSARKQKGARIAPAPFSAYQAMTAGFNASRRRCTGVRIAGARTEIGAIERGALIRRLLFALDPLVVRYAAGDLRGGRRRGRARIRIARDRSEVYPLLRGALVGGRRLALGAVLVVVRDAAG